MKRTRLHHVGIIMPTMEQAEDFMRVFGFEKDYMEYVEAYQADCLFTKYGPEESPVELIIPRGGVLLDYREGKGGLHHIAGKCWTQGGAYEKTGPRVCWQPAAIRHVPGSRVHGGAGDSYPRGH